VKTSSAVFLSSTNASLHLWHVFAFGDGVDVGRQNHVANSFKFIVHIHLSDAETATMIDIADFCKEGK